MIRKYPLCDENPDGLSGGPDNSNQTTNPQETQTARTNTETANTANANTENANTETANTNWQGDERYFQSGDKAGQLKPKFREKKSDEKRPPKAGEFKGLDFGGLKSNEIPVTASQNSQQNSGTETDKKKPNKAEKKLIEAKTGAVLAMRLLDTVNNWISRGQYGKDFTPEERAARNEYRDALEKDWENYLLTLDIPMHPGLVVAFGSMMYCAPAFNTVAGQERAATLKEKIIGRAVGWMFKKS